MGVTRWLLLFFGLISAACGLFIFLASFVIWGVSLSVEALLALFFALIVAIVPGILACFAARDLKAIPLTAQERFVVVHLNLLGWTGALLIVWGVWPVDLWILLNIGSLSLSDALVNMFSFVKRSADLALLGAACLYARYRIAANKRLAAASDH